VADVQLSALETDSGSGITFTIPLLPTAQQSSATLALETAASSGCVTATDCVNYSMVLPAGGPSIGAYSASGVTLVQSSSLASYIVDGLAFVPSSGGTPDCSPSEQKSQLYILVSNFNVPVQTLAFPQCQ
jgi:hypothetical protein